MDFLDSLDLHTTDEKSNRVRSWYLYEQYKSLEKSQLDAAKELKNRSYQDRILHRELNERRARRQFHLHHSESHIEKTPKRKSSRTPYSESTDSFFESVYEQEDLYNEKEQDSISQHSETSKFYDDFKSFDNKINNSRSESINSVIENTEAKEDIDDIKVKLEFVKKNIAEIINLQIETEKECLEKYTELCDEKSSNNDALKSIEKRNVKTSTAVDKFYPKYDSGLLAMWSKLVTFSYNVMQMNRGNCYYDYSSQFLTGVLAFDVLRKGINRMCHILQPYVSPIKFANDEYSSASLTNFNHNQKRASPKKSSKILNQTYCPFYATQYAKKHRTFERKYHSEDKWQSRCIYSFEKRMNDMRTHGTSEPYRSTAKFSGGKNSFKEKLSWNKSAQTSQKNKCSSYCSCRHFTTAISPLIKVSKYIYMILREIEE